LLRRRKARKIKRFFALPKKNDLRTKKLLTYVIQSITLVILTGPSPKVSRQAAWLPARKKPVGGITMKSVKRFLKEEDGVTSLEYGLIAAAICTAIVAVMGTLGTNLKGIFTTIAAALVPA
jgi:pilus assembly protein Flp/PilA